jgi:solute carrier family 6 (neurotransmitter transporter, glycine) member 5/9
MCKGIKSSGKVVYFTATFPFVIIFILGVKGWTLPGAALGVKYFITPDWSKLRSTSVWYDAAVQVFFSLSSGYGGMITLASYNKFHQHTLRDTLVVSICNAATSIFAGFVVFSYIGHLAYKTNQLVADTVSSGAGLAFIVYPFAVTQLPGAPFWAVIFFLMLLTLGVDSEFAMVENIMTSLFDVKPKLVKFKMIITASFCVVCFLIGLIFTTHAGMYWLELVDNSSAGWAILTVGIVECICIGWVYGPRKFATDVSLMIGPSFVNSVFYWYFIITIKFITPAMSIALVIFSFVKYVPFVSGDYKYPEWVSF